MDPHYYNRGGYPPQSHQTPNFTPLEFIPPEENSIHKGPGSIPGGGVPSPYPAHPRTLKGMVSDSSSAYPRRPVGAVPFAVPAPGPSVWTSPFGAAVAALGGSEMSGALATATEAESHVRRGLAAANVFWPSFMEYLRGYFAVSHFSVGNKLLGFLFPPLGYKLLWRSPEFLRAPQSSSGGALDDTRETKRAHHNIDHLGPDLYLPLMSFLTYVLLYVLSKAAINIFHPELLSSTASFAAGLTCLEVFLLVTVFYLSGVQLLVLEILSVAGQKFESLVVILLSGILIGRPSNFYYGIFLYFSLCAAFSTFQSFKACELRRRANSEWGSQGNRPAAFLYINVVAALCQIPMCWIMTPSFMRT